MPVSGSPAGNLCRVGWVIHVTLTHPTMRKALHLLLGFVPCGALAQSSCSDALPVGPGLHVVPAVSGTAATIQCNEANTAAVASMWYVYTASQDTAVRIATHVDGYPDVDTRISVVTGTCGMQGCLTGDDDSGPVLTSVLGFRATAGEPYYIILDAHQATTGFAFTVEEYAPPFAPVDQVVLTGQVINTPGPVLGVVDMNDDGLDDAVSPGIEQLTINHQQADGQLPASVHPHPSTFEPATRSLAVGDIDNDGYNDLFYAGAQNSFHVLHAGDNGGSYTVSSPVIGAVPYRCTLVDADADGLLDALVTGDVGANLLLENDGAGELQFNNVQLGSICGNKGAIWSDMNNDGRADLFLTKSGCDPVDQLLINNGGLSFTSASDGPPIADGHQGRSTAVGDLDNDGDMDLYIGASGSPNWSFRQKLLRNNGDGTFTNVTMGSGLELFTGTGAEWTTHDMNNDGWLDIIGGTRIHYGIGDMKFVQGGAFPATAFGDLDNNGALDAVDLQIIWFNTGNSNHCIRIRTIGTVSNRNGIGARVEVTSGSGTRIRDIRSGEGQRYMSSLFAHVGLGADDAVTSVVVRWPSGIVDEVQGPFVDTLITVVEGSAPTGHVDIEAPMFHVYPDPASDQLWFTGVELSNGSQVELLDATGKLVSRQPCRSGSVDVRMLEPGAYVVRILDGDVPLLSRFIKD